MINFSYLKQTARSNLKFLLAFTAVLCVFVTIMTNVFTPAVMEETQSGIEGTVLANILTGNGTLIGFMSNSFYALMAILFPMVYSIMVGNRLIAEKIDKEYIEPLTCSIMQIIHKFCVEKMYKSELNEN